MYLFIFIKYKKKKKKFLHSAWLGGGGGIHYFDIFYRFNQILSSIVTIFQF